MTSTDVATSFFGLLVQAAKERGLQWWVGNLSGACADCPATAVVTGHPGTKYLSIDVSHEDGCPVRLGLVPWQYGTAGQ